MNVDGSRRVDWRGALVEMRGIARSARPHAVHLGITLLVLAVLYYATLRWLVNAWSTDPYYSHGFLVPPVAAFFLWRARQSIRAAPADGWRLVNVAPVAAAALLYLWGLRTSDPFLMSLSLILLLFGLVLYVQGWARARHVLFPAAFLLLAIPFPNLLQVGLVFQQIATTGTTWFLSLFGLEMVQDNFTITAGSLAFQVIPMCSGLSSTISILTLVTAVTSLFALPLWGRAVAIAASVPIALGANILRISLTIWIGLRWGPAASEGFLHGASSLVLFLIALGATLALILALDKIAKRGKVASHD